MATTKKKSASSKSASSRSTAGKSGGSQKAAANYKAAYEQNKRSRRQMSAIILFVLGVLLLCIELIPGVGIWQWSKEFLFGIMGFVAFILPVALIYIAVMATMDKPIGAISHKVYETAALAVLICGLAEICTNTPFDGEGLIEVIKILYINGKTFASGGVFSVIIGRPLLLACGKIGAIIIIALLLFTFAMLLTGSTLIGFFKGIAKPVKKVSETYNQIRENTQELKENSQKFDIDVDLGPEPPMPEHPVSSPKPTLEELLEMEKKESEEMSRKKLNQKSAQKVIEAAQAVNTDVPIAPIEEKPVYSEKAPVVKAEETPPEEKSNVENVDESGILIDKDGQAKLYTDENNVLSRYVFPPISLLKAAVNRNNVDVSEDLKNSGDLLVNTLKSFGVSTKIINISRGPSVTRYELQPAAGVKISKITGLADDIALNLAAAGVRIEAPIPNKPAVGIEIPNKTIDTVTMREIIESDAFDSAKSKLSIALGKDIAGNCVIADVGKMPHMLIAGATGSGKSVCINSIIVSLLYKSSPSEVRFLMVDPKVVELGVYNGIPHLLVPVVTDPRKAAGALAWAVTEMLNRYKLFAENNVRDISSYNVLAQSNDEISPMPQIVIIIDELADLMMAAPNEVEDSICRLAQMARAAGMHLIIATQRPSVDVITGIIKANIPSRIAFAVSSQVDSRTIIDGAGAEKLLGRGDMLFYPVELPKPLRVQGCYVSDKEIENVVNFIKNKESAEYDNKIIEEIEKQAVAEKNSGGSDSGSSESDGDELLPDAIECIMEAGQASTSYLQRKLKVGYARAARLIDEMEEKGIIGSFEGSKPRPVLISRQQWIEMKMQKDAAKANSAVHELANQPAAEIKTENNPE